jgi:PAS domain S-box-containing protein
VRPPPEPANDAERLAALRSYGVLDTARDEAFDALVRVAAGLCDVPYAIISLIDERRQWLLSSVGFEGATETPRETAFSAHAILGTEMLVVEDARLDERFADNPLVAGDGRVRFYAGLPLVDRAGFALGALCVIDVVPRALAAHQALALRELSTAVVRLLEARRDDAAVAAAEAAARGARTDLAAVLDSVAGLVGYWDANHVNRFANHGYAEFFGRPAASLVGLHMRDVLGDHHYELGRPYVEAALRGERVRFARVGCDALGRRRHGVVTYTPDARDGRVHGFVATVADVTELHDALRLSERRTEQLQLAEEQAGVGHWRVELGGGEVYWSPQVFRIHGRDPAGFAPTVDAAIGHYHPDDRAAVGLAFERAVAEGEPFEFVRRLVRADGAVRTVHSKGRAELDPVTGEARAVFGVFQDITEREALRERVERQERLVTTGTFAAGVGHEINNPLAYVGANIDYALDELRGLSPAPPAAKLAELLEVLGDAREGAERIAAVVRGLRSFAREGAAVEPTDVNAAVDTAVELAMRELRGRVTVTRRLGEVPRVMAREERLSQVVANLLANAAQAFASADPGANRVAVRTALAPDGRVVLEVEDNGPGIAADVLPRVFDPFFTTRPVGHGTGLGLSICHSIVTSLGGEITCATAPGRGTVFRVALPARAEAPSPAAEVAPGPAAARVLVVDDDDAVLRAITRVLRPEHEVTALADPREALRAIEAGAAFDVVFCDLMMPHLSGMELFRRVREARPALAERFVFISGGITRDEVRAFLAAVPNERLAKPFARDALRGAARRFAGAGPAAP